MGLEIEHKYLVKDNSFRALAIRQINISQGYLCREKERTIRVRLADNKGYLTVKGVTKGAARKEFEVEISADDAREMLEMCEGNIIEKTRYIVPFEGFEWEIDCFHGKNENLIVAEIEIPEENCVYPIPPFIGENVTGKKRYYNSNL